MSGPLRIVHADDADSFRATVDVLMRTVGVEVVAKAGDLIGLLAAVQQHAPDLVLSDMRMPPTNTDEGERAAAALRPRGIGVILLSQSVEPAVAVRLAGAGATGAGFGYLLKERMADLQGFVTRMRRVARGGIAVDEEVVEVLVRRARHAGRLAALDEDQLPVLEALARGEEVDGSSVLAALGLSTDDGPPAIAALRALGG